MSDINKLVFLVLEDKLDVESTGKKLGEAGSEAWQGIKNTAGKLKDAASEFQHHNPTTAGAAAGVVGGVGAYILGKKAYRKYRESQYG